MSIDSKYTKYIKCNGKIVTINNLDKIESDDDDETITGMSKKDIIEFEEEEGYSCK